MIAIAATAAIVGDNVGYLIGRKAGRRLLEAPGPFERHRRGVIAYGQPFFDRHGPKAVFLGRFVGRPAHHRRMAGGRQPHALEVVPVLERHRRHRLATTIGVLAYASATPPSARSRRPGWSA